MGSVEVTPISLPRDAARFVKTWSTIYADDPHWVAPLLFERKRFLDPGRNPYFDVADVGCFVASVDGRDVGTIAATVDHLYQEHEPGTGFFGFFHFVDDPAVARALFVAARSFLTERGMHRAIGPSDFNTNHEFGLLIEGFEHDPFVLNPYNGDWYPPIYESLGLEPAMDWFAYHVDASMPGLQKMARIGDRLLDRNPELRIRNLDLGRYDEEVERLHAIYDDAWEENWGHVRVTEREFRFLAEGLKEIIDPGLAFVVERGARTVGISVTLPDVNQALKRMEGRLFPTGWWHYLRRSAYIDRVRVFMLGIARDHQQLPLGALLYARTFAAAEARGLARGEASLILENNHRMRGALEKMGATVEKTYRSYVVDL